MNSIKLLIEDKRRKNELPFDINEYEGLNDFELLLQELRGVANVNLEVVLGENSVFLDLYSDFALMYISICYLFEKIQKEKYLDSESFDLFFCEQGSEFHLIHHFENNKIRIDFLKEKGAGLPNRSIPNFSAYVTSSEYLDILTEIFNKISTLIATKLPHQKNNLALSKPYFYEIENAPQSIEITTRQPQRRFLRSIGAQRKI